MDITAATKKNAQAIERELQWLSKMIESAIEGYFNTGNGKVVDTTAPDLKEDTSSYASVVKQFSMNEAERLLLILTAAPYLRPQLLDTFFAKNTNYDRGFTEFGGIKGVQHSGFIPTGETFAFILSSMQLDKRLAVLHFFNGQHFFTRNNIIKLAGTGNEEPVLSHALHLSQEYLSLLTTGEKHKPEYSVSFPALLLQTPLSWKDLVLSPSTAKELQEIITWIQSEKTLLQQESLAKFIRKGYRSLFYGPPGTGKTLTASLIGKETGLDVYRIDLSMIVSKYIGETEKNLASLFDMAENKNWVLFFDEADALFGKRSQTKDAHDRYANQEIAYLLQRIEEHPGPVILATNLKGNIDPAFLRRFHAVVYFQAPGVAERARLWKNLFGNNFIFEKDVDFEKLAEEHAITGGVLVNVLRYCAGKAIQNNNTISLRIIKDGLARELQKEGKMI